MLKILLLVCCFVCPQLEAKKILLDRIVAVVNEDIVTLSDVNDVETVIKKQKEKLTAEESKNLPDTPLKILNKIIDSKIIKQYLKDNKLEPTKDEIDSLIARRARAMGMSLNDVDKELLASGQTRDSLREDLKIEQGKATIFDRELKKKITISDKDYETFFKNNFNQDINVSEYKIRHILTKDQKTADKVFEQIKSGADFATLAKKYSEDMATKNNSGDLGFVDSSSLLPEMKAAVEKMAPGDIRPPIRTRLGYHVIKLETTRIQKNPEFLKNRDSIERALIEKDFNRQLALWLDEKKEEYYVRVYI